MAGNTEATPNETISIVHAETDLTIEPVPAETEIQAEPELKIDPEFKAVIQPHTAGESAVLEEDISLHGCRDPITVLKGEGIILDGHHRYEICERLGIPYEVVELEFSSRTEAKIWMIKNQRGRRNLNESQRAMLAVTLEALYADQAIARQGTRTDLGQNSDQSEAGRSAEKAARDMGISHQTVSFAKKVAQKGIPELARIIGSGDVAVSAAAQIASQPRDIQDKIVKDIANEISEGRKPKVVSIMRKILPSNKEDADARLEKFRKNQKASLELLQGIETIEHPENLIGILAIAEKIEAKLKEIEKRSLDPLAKLASVLALDYYDHELLSLISSWQPIKYFKLQNKFKKRNWSGNEVGIKVTKLIKLNLIYMQKYKTRNGTAREVKVRKLTQNPTLFLTEAGKNEAKRHADTLFKRFERH